MAYRGRADKGMSAVNLNPSKNCSKTCVEARFSTSGLFSYRLHSEMRYHLRCFHPFFLFSHPSKIGQFCSSTARTITPALQSAVLPRRLRHWVPTPPNSWGQIASPRSPSRTSASAPGTSSVKANITLNGSRLTMLQKFDFICLEEIAEESMRQMHQIEFMIGLILCPL